MREILTLQSIKENPKVREIVTYQSILILTYQSIKENPKSARDTNVTINKRESKKYTRY